MVLFSNFKNIFKMHKFILLLSLFAICDSAIVSTEDGLIEGKIVKYENVEYLSYQGVPFAEPPTGSRRFMPPVQKMSWTNLLDATRERSVCPQSEGRYTLEQMNEDCLFLNVYVPINNCTSESLPVLVYAHGGEFKALSGNDDVIYGPQLYMKKGVIVVTFNYRLGSLGFLSLNIPEASGNAGLKDAILAIKWVNRNIKYFGGDEQKITIGGNSAGAVLVHYLTLSKKTTGIFQRAFLISGSALSYRFLARHPVENAKKLAKHMGLKSNDSQEILTMLKETNAFDIIKAEADMGKENKRNGVRPFAPFVPCLEVPSCHAVITDEPIDIIKSGLPQNVPILAGFNAQEGIKMLPAIKQNKKLIQNLNDNFELCIPSDLEYPLGSKESTDLAEAIKQFYFNNNNITDSNLGDFVNFITDTQFYHSIDYWIKLHKKNYNSNSMYFYMFNYSGGLNWFKLVNSINFYGTAHADELGYMFVTEATKALGQNEIATDKLVEENILTLWTNFIKHGIPTRENRTFWPESGVKRDYLLLNDQPTARTGPPLPARAKFWTDVYENFYNYVNDGGDIEYKIVP